ncbi:MAG: ATP-binding protein [Gemmatimonadetes bacterium]|nr:ATP-binding protein [Gemmatimonadota bacterium]
MDETAGQLARTLEARELEMQLLQSARLVSLGQMAAGVAHELNQPLTVVETTAGDICLRLIEGIPLGTDELREMMENVRGVVDRMAGTVDHLRVFSRDVSEEPREAMDVNAVVESSLEWMQTQFEHHGVDLVLDLSNALPEVWGHPHPLEQVVLNLLSNARDAVNERTEVEDADYDKRIWIRTHVEDDAVVIEVEDNGVGMDETTRQRLFEPFFTTKDADRGTGLGLSIIYAIVRNHDGEVSVESERGVGTMFRVRLPVLERDPPSA